MADMQFSYETINNSSYLVATFPNGEGVINYQVQMLTNNDIKNVIKASKRQKNEDILISYNITSKISLEQSVSRNKITKAGMINLITGAVAALEDIEEYQLVSAGLVFEEKYIYINPSTYEPDFVYLPCYTEDSGIEPLKKILLSFIMESKVEITNDNFIPVLLDTLNKPALTPQDLKEVCLRFKSGASARSEARQSGSQARAAEKPSFERPQQAQHRPADLMGAFQGERKSVPPQPGSKPFVTPLKPGGVPKPEDVLQKSAKNGGGKDGKGKTVVFAIIQIAIIAAVAAIVLSGALNGENGGLKMEYLLGIVIGALGIDFVIFREMFVNKKNKGDKKGKKTAPASPNKPGVPIPGKEMPSANKPPVNKPGTPSAIPNQAVKTPAPPVIPAKPAYNIPKKVAGNEPPSFNSMNSLYPQPNQKPAPEPVINNPLPVSGFDEYDNEGTVVLSEDKSSPHLEYFENGLVRKIKLNKEVVTVGRLRKQCDYAIENNKISKIHAEFIVRDGNYYVIDCNSTNGTFINGGTQRITSNVEHQLFDGDRVTLANVDLTLRC
ncbi:MAG: FHA domain-containing protein [Clostridia bacterium]|nr:FHA domain-containing protein [Clostridia bacterium]